jgi:hypothetical protein
VDLAVNSPTQELSLILNDSRGKQVAKKDKSTTLKHSFVAEKSGSVQICINSQASDTIEFDFSMTTGVDSKDYSALITKDNMRPAEAQAVKVIDMVKQLKDELTNLVQSEAELKAQNDSIEGRVYYFGIIAIIVMAVTTFVQIQYLKNFFKHKKII